MKNLNRLAALPALFGAITTAKTTFPDCVNGPKLLTSNLVCNTSATPAERAAAIIGAWNITEKLANLINTSPGTSRLGLSPYEWWSEALHGVGGSPGVSFAGSGQYAGATSFASPILLSAAFDDELVNAVADVISTEARAFSNAGRGGLDYWTPNINPYKDPRWGRGSETPGEDPFRIKQYIKALIPGLQGSQETTKVIATCKHYAAYDLERWHGLTRYQFDAIVSMQDLVEYYLPPFQECARDSKVKSIMCSYNSVNGTPACASTYLMDTVLRDFWEWNDENQYVTSDCNAVLNFHADHHYTKTAAQSAALALNAGTDTICQTNANTDVKGAWNQSLMEESVIDRALRRLYEGLVRAGYFNPASSTSYRSLAWKDVNTTTSQALAIRSAVDGLVLKKNNGALPLANTTKSLALIGFWASNTNSRAMLGPYSGNPAFYHTPADAARKLGYTITTATGPRNESTSASDTWTTAALTAARNAEVIVYFGGGDQSIASEDLDRNSIATPGAQLALINRLGALGKPLVVVQMGDQNDDTPLLTNANVSAIVWAGFPGQDGGTAVFDVLTGRSAPAGRLPVTVYPADYVNQVPLTDMNLRPATGNPGRTYKWYNKAVLPFGHGLHYTTFNASFASGGAAGKTFAIADLLAGCTERYTDLCAFSTPVGVSVRNTGKVTSDYVALVFVSGEYGPSPRPLKQLAAYTRLKKVAAGTTATAELTIRLGELARVDGNGNTVLYPGTYRLLLDVPSQANVTFQLTGDPVTLINFPQPPKDLGAGNGHENL